MRVLKALKHDAEAARKRLSKLGMLEPKYKAFSDDKFVYFPIRTSADASAASEYGTFIDVNREKLRNAGHARYLSPHYSSSVGNASRSYDILGNIAVIEAGNASDARKLAKYIMQTNRNVKTVVRKGGAVRGRFRKRKYVYVAGKRNFMADYKENGCRFVFDIRKTFFSARLSFERKRITETAKDGETVMVMFAGVGPFAIELAKARRRSRVIAIELNAYAHDAMEKNIALNKTGNVTAVKGDAGKAAKSLRGIADRIIMPLPKDSEKFLDAAFAAAKKKCMVHYYAFGNRDTAFADSKRLISDFLKKRGASARFVFEREVRQYSPSEIEIVLDFIIRK